MAGKLLVALFAVATVGLPLTGCSKSAPTATTPPVETPASPEVRTATLADVGLELASLDRRIGACDDFYHFACGGWLAATTIPADKSIYGRFHQVHDQNERWLGELLDAAVTRPTGQADKKIGAFFASCMDEASIEKVGIAGIAPLLTPIAQLATTPPSAFAKAFSSIIGTLHAHGIRAAFAAYPEADNLDSTTYLLTLDSGGLSLPSRDYYLDAAFARELAAYKAHLARVFERLGQAPASALISAANVVAVETALATLTKTNVQRRDVPGMYNPTPSLTAVAPQLDWTAYFTQIGLGQRSFKVNVTSPDYYRGLGASLASVKPAAWVSYLTYRVVASTANTLPKAFRDEAFALRKVIRGVTEDKPQRKQCIDATGAALPELVGQRYVETHFSGHAKTTAVEMITAIGDAMGKRIAELPWMSDATKTLAAKKLAALEALVGYPDAWRAYDFEVVPGRFTQNSLAADKHEALRQFAKAGTPYDRNEWLMPTFIVNAYYNPSANNTGLPAGILQPPFFGKDRSIAANMGGIGMVIGHELTHGFDDQGAQFDERGNMKNWWTKDDAAQFASKGQCVVDQYNGFEPLPGKRLNGALTLGENIADIGGVKMAYFAYRAQRAGAVPQVVADGFTEDQQFFLGVAQAWCSKARDEETLMRLGTDVHAPAQFRVNGALRNLPEFATAFGCAADAPMNPSKRCEVW
ncbi:MAG: M13 family metallopeptidase [Myxococcales bacterium]|nr:M13 family metallopeptidase [Myxococcales bacterium]